jgi:hypothetical protein
MADQDLEQTLFAARSAETRWRGRSRRSTGTSLVAKAIAPALIVILCVGHGLAIWLGLGGKAGITSGWPLARDDHPLYFHSALVTRSFLKDTHTTSGYDPYFMSGYAKSVVFPASSTLPELVVALFGGSHPELAYKLYVLVSAAAVPWLVAAACALWSLRVGGSAVAVFLVIAYIWTDFPINYAAFGMLPYLLSIPVALCATGAFGRFLEQGGPVLWLSATVLFSLSVLVHLTSAMVAFPAALLAYLMGARRGTECTTAAAGEGTARREPTGMPAVQGWSPARHAAVWLIPVVVLAANAFWWLPGIFLASTKGASDFAFSHSRENVIVRLAHIFSVEPPVQSVLLAAGLPGLAVLACRKPLLGWALCGFTAAGFAWGYLAGALKSLDFLQPGRHSYAFYLGLALAGGAAGDELLERLRLATGAGRFERWLLAGVLAIAVRFLGSPLVQAMRIQFASGEPFLTSNPSRRMVWVVERVRRHVQPGERLLYEEGGKEVDGLGDPFQRGRFSGFLPHYAGIEVIGGPYLHAALTTNFTQFGEGKLFGESSWDRGHFVRYARLYRPAAILCWSPHARRFCRAHPDLIQIVEDDGVVMIGRVIGFAGDTIRGSAKVEARANRILVRDMSPDLDGTIVLRYHFVPYLVTSPPVACESELLEEDPVPFIRLRPPPGTRDVELKLAFPDRL